MPPIVRPALAPVLLCLFLSIHAHNAAAADTVDRAVRELYQAYAGTDVAALKAISDLPDLEQIAWRMGAMARASCRTLEGIRVIESNAGVVRAEVALVRNGRASFAKPQREDHTATLELALRDGRWIITAWRIDEQELAARIAGAEPAEQRRALMQTSLDGSALSRALSVQATRLINEGRHDVAGELVAEALALSQMSGDRAAAALALSLRSTLARISFPADLTQSVSDGEESVRIAEEAGDADVLAKALLRRGRAINAATARVTFEDFKRILAMADDLEDASTLVLTGTQLGLQSHGSGDPLAALRYAEVTRLYAARTDDPMMQMQPDLHLAGIYVVADGHLALEHATDALRIARKAGYSVGIAAALHILTLCYNAADEDELYLAASDEALQRFHDANRWDSELSAHLHRARFHKHRRQFEDAQRHIDAALAISSHDARGFSIDAILLGVAELELARDRPEAALAALNRRKLAANASETEWQHFWLAAIALKGLGQCDKAYENFEIWLRIMENGRMLVPGGDRQRRIAFEWPVIATWPLIDMLVSDGRHIEALSIAEWTRSRTLLDVQTRGSADVDESHLSPEELRERNALETRVSRLKHESAATAASAEGISTLRRARVELGSFRALMAAKHPPAVIGRHVARADLATPLTTPKGTALVAYIAASDALYIWSITSRGVRAHRVWIAERALQDLIATHVGRIESRDFRHAESGKKLFDMLLGPVWEEVRGARTIGFVPDRMIWQAPMQTLTAPDGRMVVEHAAVFYVPSLTVLAELSERRVSSRSNGTAVVIADPTHAPDLPEAAAEARKVAASYARSTLLANGNADETRAREAMPRASILHFATHGQFDDDDPMFSHLLLRPSREGGAAEDGYLEAWEIARMRLDADLAVLSACETARGQVSFGEGLVGMSWAFLAAGARTTVVSQWNVDSRATARLMADFHRRHAAGASASAALRAAQLRMLEQPQYRHPMYWAPFIVVGAQ